MPKDTSKKSGKGRNGSRPSRSLNPHQQKRLGAHARGKRQGLRTKPRDATHRAIRS